MSSHHVNVLSDRKIRIAIFGAFNFSYRTHLAINVALNHAIDFLEIDCDYIWIQPKEWQQFNNEQKKRFDGFWFAPKPFLYSEFIQPTLLELMDAQRIVLITDDVFKNFIETVSRSSSRKYSSDSVLENSPKETQQFEDCTIHPVSHASKRLYENIDKNELTTTKFSYPPDLFDELTATVLDVEATDSIGNPVIVSLKTAPFFVACSFCPQISSSKKQPHPIIYTFLKAVLLTKTVL